MANPEWTDPADWEDSPTLDEALDRFEAEPSATSAHTLRAVASEYHADDMIEDGEFASIMSRTASFIVGVRVVSA